MLFPMGNTANATSKTTAAVVSPLDYMYIISTRTTLQPCKTFSSRIPCFLLAYKEERYLYQVTHEAHKNSNSCSASETYSFTNETGGHVLQNNTCSSVLYSTVYKFLPTKQLAVILIDSFLSDRISDRF